MKFHEVSSLASADELFSIMRNFRRLLILPWLARRSEFKFAVSLSPLMTRGLHDTLHKLDDKQEIMRPKNDADHCQEPRTRTRRATSSSADFIVGWLHRDRTRTSLLIPGESESETYELNSIKLIQCLTQCFRFCGDAFVYAYSRLDAKGALAKAFVNMFTKQRFQSIRHSPARKPKTVKILIICWFIFKITRGLDVDVERGPPTERPTERRAA